MFDDLTALSPDPAVHTMDLRDQLNQSILLKLVKHDAGLPKEHKQSIFGVLNSPEVFDNLLAGTAGAALSLVITRYMDVPPVGRTLLGLAGFGIGTILMNTLHERKFTDYDPQTGKSRIKL